MTREVDSAERYRLSWDESETRGGALGADGGVESGTSDQQTSAAELAPCGIMRTVQADAGDTLSVVRELQLAVARPDFRACLEASGLNSVHSLGTSRERPKGGLGRQRDPRRLDAVTRRRPAGFGRLGGLRAGAAARALPAARVRNRGSGAGAGAPPPWRLGA